MRHCVPCRCLLQPPAIRLIKQNLERVCLANFSATLFGSHVNTVCHCDARRSLAILPDNARDGEGLVTSLCSTC
jgi:hypothetical protein